MTEVVFFITLLRMAKTLLSIGTRVPHARQTNGRATSRVTIDSIGHKYRTRSGPEKKPRSFGQFGTKRLLLMSGGLALHRPASISKQCVFFASLTLANRSNTDFGIALKPEGHGNGPHVLCMNCVGLELVTMTILIGSNFCLEKEFLRNTVKWSKFGTF